MSVEPDTRTQAVNQERGVVEPALAGQFPELRILTPRTAYVTDSLGLRAGPFFSTPQVTEALHGEALEVLEDLTDGWAWGRTLHDGYLGYIHRHQVESLSLVAPIQPITVQVPRTHLYAAPSVKAAILGELGRGATLSTLDPEPAQHGEYLWWRVEYQGREAYLHAAATQPGKRDLESFVAGYLHTPYVWGGRSAWGLDCSGLSQLWAGQDAAGKSLLPRDADQQQAATTPVERPEAGDLAFFEGHVGVMLDAGRMLHANATHLRVTVERLGEGEYGRKLAAGLLGFGRIGGLDSRGPE
ncbi:NlpC/P60 family protein [Deinococcus sp.]|uniref:C40 family peptidase n=1 Tax=Deinococcus sp. TaxID=47478 RepID=UPI003C7EAA6B